MCSRCLGHYYPRMQQFERDVMDLSIQGDLWWGATLILPSWAGYQSRFGPYTSIDKPEPSNGKALFIFAPDGRGAEPLSPEEADLVSWFEAHEPEVSKAVKAAILNHCSDHALAPIADEEDLKRNVGLYSVNVHPLAHGGVPYIGYELGCYWEEEHGLGVMMHGTRLVDIGHADTALHLWVARKDAAVR